MIHCEDLRVGDHLRSLDPRDENRTVRVIEIHDGKVRVERVHGNRRTFLKMPTQRWEHTP